MVFFPFSFSLLFVQFRASIGTQIESPGSELAPLRTLFIINTLRGRAQYANVDVAGGSIDTVLAAAMAAAPHAAGGARGPAGRNTRRGKAMSPMSSSVKQRVGATVRDASGAGGLAVWAAAVAAAAVFAAAPDASLPASSSSTGTARFTSSTVGRCR